MRISISLLLFFGLAVLLRGEALDTVRAFDQAALAEYHDNPEFDYTSDYAKSGSWFSLLLIYMLDLIGRFFEATGVGWLAPYFFQILMVVVLLSVLYYVVKHRYGGLLDREGRAFDPGGFVVSTGERVEYDVLINESLASGAFKMAIRYQFLKCLHELNENGFLKITPWKAPLDYVEELPEDKKTSYNELTRLFEVTWYGDYEADEVSYQRCSESAKQLVG